MTPPILFFNSPERRRGSSLSHSVSAIAVGTTSLTAPRDNSGDSHPSAAGGLRIGGNQAGGIARDKSRSPYSSPDRDNPLTNGIGGGFSGVGVEERVSFTSPGGDRKTGGVTSGAAVIPEENFLSSLHLDRHQLSQFYNSEGHFLYLRQKPGADATAYNLEVSVAELRSSEPCEHITDVLPSSFTLKIWKSLFMSHKCSSVFSRTGGFECRRVHDTMNSPHVYV